MTIPVVPLKAPPRTKTAAAIHQEVLEEAVVKVAGYFYTVDFGPGVCPQHHRVGKDKRCCCHLGTSCPAVVTVSAYLKNGGERTPDPPPGYYPVAPLACPICSAEVVYDHRLSSKYRGAGWRCKKAGSFHYWRAHTLVLRQKLAANPWLFPPVVIRDGDQTMVQYGIEDGDEVLYPGLKRADVATIDPNP